MKYSDIYECKDCPVKQYCGTMIQSIKLCNSYQPRLQEL